MMKTYAWLTALILLVLTGTLSAQPGVTIDYCTYMGGSMNDNYAAVTTWHGRLILGGNSFSSDYPVTLGVYKPVFDTGAYSNDAVITILSQDGHDILASTYFGGMNRDYIYAVASDDRGNIYIAGKTYSTDLQGTPGAYQVAHGSNTQGFVASLAADLTTLRWFTFVDTPWPDWGYDAVCDIVHDGRGHVDLVAWNDNPDAFQLTGQWLPERGGCIVLQLNDDDGSFVWGSDIGRCLARDIDLLQDGTIVIAASTGDSLRVSADAFQAEHQEGFGWDHYIAAMDPADGSFLWATYIGGSGEEGGLAIAPAPDGSVWFAGTSNSIDYPVTGTSWGQHNGGTQDVVVGKITNDGRELAWCGYLGGSHLEGEVLYPNPVGLVVDDAGGMYLFATTRSVDLPVTPGCYDSTYAGGQVSMIASLDGNDGQLRWLTYFGGTEAIWPGRLSLSPKLLACVGGVGSGDSSEPLPVTDDAWSDSLNGEYDAFVLLWHLDDIVPTQLQSADLAWDSGTAVLRWRLAGDAAPLRAEVVTAAGARELPVQQEPGGAWTARDDRACAEGTAPRTYRLVLPGENRWTVLWRREVTPECAAASPLRLAGRLLGGGAVELRLRSPQAGTAQLAIYDLAGRRVAALPGRTVPAGESVWEWDGRTEAGARAPAGRYLARCTVGGRVVTAAVTLVR